MVVKNTALLSGRYYEQESSLLFCELYSPHSKKEMRRLVSFLISASIVGSEGIFFFF